MRKTCGDVLDNLNGDCYQVRLLHPPQQRAGSLIFAVDELADSLVHIRTFSNVPKHILPHIV